MFSELKKLFLWIPDSQCLALLDFLLTEQLSIALVNKTEQIILEKSECGFREMSLKLSLYGQRAEAIIQLIKVRGMEHIT